MPSRNRLFLIVVCVAILAVTFAPTVNAQEESKPLVLAHYMPWYAAKPTSKQWGWHWTMNHFNPDQVTGSKREIASHFYPLIGPYDSGDPQVLEYHLLLMKLAGIEGVIVDWYGLSDFRDYAVLHRNTERLVEQVERLGMKLVICYEDQTIPALVKANRLNTEGRVVHAAREIQWMANKWFKLDCYVRLNGLPVLLSFGNSGLTNKEWTSCLGKLESPVAYFSEHHRRSSAVGGFDWPIPQQGLSQIDRFNAESSGWRLAIPVAFPRFIDVYAKAKVNDGYGRIEDEDGKTFRTTLAKAFASKAAIIQIATWNDWGEGTQIEPSLEYGYRDLEEMQKLRRRLGSERFLPTATDLRLPSQLLQLHRSRNHDESRLAQIVQKIVAGDLATARAELMSLGKSDD